MGFSPYASQPNLDGLQAWWGALRFKIKLPKVESLLRKTLTFVQGAAPQGASTVRTHPRVGTGTKFRCNWMFDNEIDWVKIYYKAEQAYPRRKTRRAVSQVRDAPGKRV